MGSWTLGWGVPSSTGLSLSGKGGRGRMAWGTVLRRLNATGELSAGVMMGRATKLHTEQKPPRQSEKGASRLERWHFCTTVPDVL